MQNFTAIEELDLIRTLQKNPSDPAFDILMKKYQEQLYWHIRGIVKNQKKRARRYQISNEEVQQQIIDNLQSDVYFSGDEIQLKLQKAISTLPEKQRLVFQMKYFQDMKYEEMSKVLDTSVGALKSSFHIATKKVTALLTED